MLSHPFRLRVVNRRMGGTVGIEPDSVALVRRLARLSADEISSALGLARVPPWVRRSAALPLLALSWPLARILARFDFQIAKTGLSAAAAEALTAFGAALVFSAPPPKKGPVLVLSNHPGAYDAFSLMAAVGRSDLAILAADRTFLRAIPALAPHLILVPAAATGRATALRQAISHLQKGGALLHFPAGCIEPDPAFVVSGNMQAPLLAPWTPGTAVLLRAAARVGGAVVVAGVSGVHSPRAKRLILNRWAERRGITTLAPLLQLAGRLRDVQVMVRFSQPRPAWPLGEGEDVSASLRGVLMALCENGGRP